MRWWPSAPDSRGLLVGVVRSVAVRWRGSIAVLCVMFVVVRASGCILCCADVRSVAFCGSCCMAVTAWVLWRRSGKWRARSIQEARGGIHTHIHNALVLRHVARVCARASAAAPDVCIFFSMARTVVFDGATTSTTVWPCICGCNLQQSSDRVLDHASRTQVADRRTKQDCAAELRNYRGF